MAKKLFLIIILLCSSTLVQIHAQTMSDEQVMGYILNEKKNGTDDKTIAQNLLKQGASVAQIKDIQKKYREENVSAGPVNVEGTNRLRDKEETDAQTHNKLHVKKNSNIYGRDLFNNNLLTFQPAMNIPTPADYILGAGDQILIDIWGATQKNFDCKISPEGSITIPGVGPIRLVGKTVSEANSTVKEMISEYFGGSSVTLTLGAIRNVKVEIVGDVVAPGSYTLSAFSTIFNALYMAGGINGLGTLRNINLFRNGKNVSKIDVYDYIINGNNKGNIRLQDNDLIIVGPYEAIVDIQGKIKRPMKYEMKKNETLANLISYSGGYTADAYTRNVRVIRKSGKEYSIHTITQEEMHSFPLENGDSVYIDAILPRFSNMVEIKGAVFHPGMYELGEKINTVMDLIEAADGLREEAFLTRAVMHRRKPDMTLFAKSIDLIGIMNGTSPDVELKKEDILFIPSTIEMRGEQTLTISGEVSYPGTYEFAENTTIEDFILQAGGLKNTASVTNIDINRRIYDSKATERSDTLIERYHFALKDGFIIDGEPTFTLMPFDEVHVRKSPVSSGIKNVSISGAVNFGGHYAITNKNYRVSDLIKDAGGLTNQAYTAGVRLYRKTRAEGERQNEIAIRNSRAQSYQERLRFDENYDMEIADALTMLRLRDDEEYIIAIDLDKVIKDPGSEDDIILCENDRLYIPEIEHTVKIRGEVNQTISVKYKKGMKVKDYIKQAGGYTDMAKKNSLYAIHLNGAVSKISKSSNKNITPGCEIIVPAKRIKKKASMSETMAIASATGTLATVIVSLISIIK